MNKDFSLYEYDVALSFAGEDRQIANKLANMLFQRGVTVFYDHNETAALWGRDLYQHLADVYTNKAIFCVILISKYYAQKNWSKHELCQAQARAFKQKDHEYILPIRIDDTEIPGLPDTVCYIKWQDYRLVDIVEMICNKLDLSISISPVNRRYTILYLHVAAGTGTLPIAALKMADDSQKIFNAAACGDNAVDATIHAFQEAVGKATSINDISIKSVGKKYHITVVIQKGEGIYRGRSVGSDLYETAGYAFLAAFERMENTNQSFPR